MPARFIIHTNSRINDTLALRDNANAPIDIVAAASYRCDIKRSRDDTEALLSFGPTGDATIAVLEIDSEDPTRNVLLLSAPAELMADLTPGLAIGDVVRIDGPDWQFEFPVSIIKGITAP